MSLLRMRRWSRLVGLVLLLATLRGLAHLDQDDLACVPAGADTYGHHDETQHGLRPGGHELQEHCAVCHWTRTLRSPRADVAGWIAELTPPSLVHGSPGGVPFAPALASLPARAPPALL